MERQGSIYMDVLLACAAKSHFRALARILAPGPGVEVLIDWVCHFVMPRLGLK